MSYVFVSHAANDKPHIKPLVQALAMEGVHLWVDRPGNGESHFNLDQEFIKRHRIEDLRSGESWRDQLLDALDHSAAVLVCLSKSFHEQRTVWTHEVLLGSYQKKLVACIIDDLDYARIPRDLGLLDAFNIQAERVRPENLRNAVDWLVNNGHEDPRRLPPGFLPEWEVVRKLVRDINRILDKSGLRMPSASEMKTARDSLAAFPISPMVRAFEIPSEIIDIYAHRFGDPDIAELFFDRAMAIRRQCNAEQFREEQILVRAGDVVSPRRAPAVQYWSDVLIEAGHKSRRTLAAFLLAPGAPAPGQLRPMENEIFESFRYWLKQAGV